MTACRARSLAAIIQRGKSSCQFVRIQKTAADLGRVMNYAMAYGRI